MRAWRVLLAFVLGPVVIGAGCALFVRVAVGPPGVAVVHVENRGSRALSAGQVYLNGQASRPLRPPLDRIPPHGSATATLDDVSGFFVSVGYEMDGRGAREASCGYPTDGRDERVWIVADDDSLRARIEHVLKRHGDPGATR